MNYMIKLAMGLYAYCTDFIINVSNLLGISYYETNAWMFCIIWPLVTIVLLIIYPVQVLRLKRIKSTANCGRS